MTVARLLPHAALLALLVAAFGCGREQDRPRAEVPAQQGYGLDGSLGAQAPAPAQRPNVLLIVIDTLRADALDVASESGGSMPALARRARQGSHFRNASSASSWTLPSVASLLTGRLPSEHGIQGEEGLASGLAPLATWAEVLGHGLGYETLAWVGEGWRGGEGTLLEGFGQVVPHASLAAAPQLVTQWAAQRSASRPYFLYVHSFEAHDPYGAANHPWPPRSRLASGAMDALAALGPAPAPSDLVRAFVLDAATRDAIVRAPAGSGLLESFARYTWSGYAARPDPALAHDLHRAYLEGVRWVDGLLEQALRTMEDAGLLRNTLVVVTGDHGEAFGEHGMLLHGRLLYDELLRVPLVIGGVGPFGPGRALDASVSLLDVFPTVLDALGLPAPEGVAGRSLLPQLRGALPGHPACAQVERRRLHTGGLSSAMAESVRNDRWKFSVTYERLAGTVREEAYDLRSDPEERHDLADAEHRVRGLAFDDAFCAAVEQARNRVWGQAASAVIQGTPGAPALAPRPPPVCAPEPAR